jgi:hypothetical protein
MTINHRLGAGVALALLVAASPVAAQTRPDPAQRPEQAPQSAPGNPNATPPEKIEPPADARESSGGSGTDLSDRLSRSGGTLKPPTNVDPGMTAAPPDPGPRSMRVIPPPGAPGGNPSVEPK